MEISKQSPASTDDLFAVIMGVIDKKGILTGVHSCTLRMKTNSGVIELNQVLPKENETRVLKLDRFAVNELYIQLKTFIDFPRNCHEVKLELTQGYLPIVTMKFTPSKLLKGE